MKWIHKNGIVLLIFAVCSILVGCCRQYLSSENVIDSKFANRKEQIAPIFKHGDGTAFYGCCLASDRRPVFCKESDAVDLIIEEFRREGIEIDMTNVRVEGIKDFRNSKFLVLFYEKISACDRWVLDGYCSEYNIGFEFISKRDCSDLGYEGQGWMWTYYDMISASSKLRTMFYDYGKMTVGVFYDPLVHVDQWIQWNDEEWDRVSDLVEESVAWKLRAQAQDFIAWLRQEGYLEPDDRERE